MSDNDSDDEFPAITVGHLKKIIEEANLDDDTPVVIVIPRHFRNNKDDNGERLAEDVSASRGYNEESTLRIMLTHVQYKRV